jgi:transcriptional regulator with XRE-family HTH domain
MLSQPQLSIFSSFSGGDGVAEKDEKKVRLGQRIRELREGAGMSRERMAEAAGVSVRAVVQWELAEREPGWFNMLALAEALGVDCTAFTQAPAEAPPPARGRPRKPQAPPAEPEPAVKPKRSRRSGPSGN